VFSRRESKKRAILKLLDRIPLRPLQARRKRKRSQSNFLDLIPAGRGQTPVS
jgi:hypothetical protein